MQAAYEDGDDESDIIPSGYFNDIRHECHVRNNSEKGYNTLTNSSVTTKQMRISFSVITVIVVSIERV